jgi:protein transport protein SEC31
VIAQGDRTHIPASSKPIYDILSSELGRVKQASHPVCPSPPPPFLPSSFLASSEIEDETNTQAPIQRIVDDTERRLNILFEGLNNETVPKSAIDKMHEIARGESLSLSLPITPRSILLDDPSLSLTLVPPHELMNSNRQ